MINEQQLEERKRFLGSSDISSLFCDESGASLNPFATASDVFAQKCYTFEPEKESKAIGIGNRHEEAMITFCENELGKKIERRPEKLRFICKEHPIFAANLDGYTIEEHPEVVEAKTTGMTEEWGEPGGDAVPFRVILQCQQQLLCTGWEVAHIAVLLGRWGLREELYRVERNEEIINSIITRGEQFWNDHVLKKVPPPDTPVGNLTLFKRIRREPELYADIDPKLIIDWEIERANRLEAEKREKTAFGDLLLALGEAEGAAINDGREFTFFEQKKNIVNTKKLKADYPDIYESVLEENKFRVARIRKIKR